MDAVIHLDQQLFDRARQLADAAGQTVDAFVAQTLKTSLEEHPPAKGEKTHLPQNHEMRLQPGIDINSTAKLLDLMDEGLDVSQRR